MIIPVFKEFDLCILSQYTHIQIFYKLVLHHDTDQTSFLASTNPKAKFLYAETGITVD